MRLMSENYQDFLEKWYMGQSTGYTGNPLSQEEARKKVLEEMPEPYYNPKHNTTKRDIYNKLGQLEDIEQELGVDLVTLFKTLKNGFYYKDYEENPDGIISFVEKNDIMLKGNIGFNRIATYDSGCFMFKDYGKTWALTREELEK